MVKVATKKGMTVSLKILGVSNANAALITILSMVTESKSVSTRRSGLTIVFKKVVVPPTKRASGLCS